jgi:hypothetical protein
MKNWLILGGAIIAMFALIIVSNSNQSTAPTASPTASPTTETVSPTASPTAPTESSPRNAQDAIKAFYIATYDHPMRCNFKSTEQGAFALCEVAFNGFDYEQHGLWQWTQEDWYAVNGTARQIAEVNNFKMLELPNDIDIPATLEAFER